MPALPLLEALRAAGFRLTVEGEYDLRITPASRLTPELRHAIKANKPLLLAALRGDYALLPSPSTPTGTPAEAQSASRPPPVPQVCTTCGGPDFWERPRERGVGRICARCHPNPMDLLAAWERRGEVAKQPIVLDPERATLLDWALAQGCPELRFRPWLTVVGTAHGWRTFVITGSADNIGAALEAAGLPRTNLDRAP
jgi:hypothetical protein